MNFAFMSQRKDEREEAKKPLSVSRPDGTRDVDLKDAVQRQRKDEKFESFKKVKIYTPPISS